MSYMSRLNRDFQKAPRLELSDASRYILMSDRHRGNGTSNDNFLKNRNLYYAALEYYDSSCFSAFTKPADSMFCTEIMMWKTPVRILPGFLLFLAFLP